MANQTTGSARVKGAFFVRKDIPPAIRELMGEYKDPFVNYANTVLKLMQNYENFKFEEDLEQNPHVEEEDCHGGEIEEVTEN